MTEMTARVRNRLGDAVGFLQNNPMRQEDQRQQYADIRRKRMTCSETVKTYRQSQDWTGNVGMSPSGRFRVIEEVRPKRRLISRDGIRWDAAIAVIVALAVIFFGILAARLAWYGTNSRMISKLDGKITAITERNEQIRLQLEAATSDASVCTEAVKMNLISSNGATTVRLTVPNNALFTLSSPEEALENEALIARMTSGNTGE